MNPESLQGLDREEYYARAAIAATGRPMELPPVRFATASDGARIAYMRWPGESPPFLVCFNTGSPPLAIKAKGPGYVNFRRVVARERSVVYFDWRGTGESRIDDLCLSNDHFAMDVDAVVDAVGPPVDAVAIGHGLFPLLVAAARRPEAFRSLWLQPGFGGVRYDPVLDRENRPGWELDYRAHLTALLTTIGVSYERAASTAMEWEKGLAKEVFAAYLRAMEGVDLEPVIAGLSIPTWVTIQQTKAATAGELVSVLGNARMSIAEGPNAQVLNAWTRDDWEANLGSRLGASVRRSAAYGAIADLTPRESDVLRAMLTGARNTGIAGNLGISEKTVARHIANIYTKLGVHNRVEAANWAREHGVV